MKLILLLPILVISVGLYFLIRLRFFILKPCELVSDVKTLLKKPGALKNLALALSGTLGVGNIAGTAVALRLGGAGSVFWLVISAIPAAVIKYSESAVAVSDTENQGMMGVIKGSFPRVGARLSRVYALLILVLAFGMGAALQCASYSEVFGVLFNTPPTVFAVLLTILILPMLFLSHSRLKDITAVFVSTASIIYVIMALWVIAVSSENLPWALGAIADGALTPAAAGGGLVGVLSSYALKEGFCRGILSNEAGLGTSALAHSSDVNYTAHEAGVIGVLEVFFDTAVLCPLTALMLLCGGDGGSGEPVKYVLSAIGRGGAVFEYAFAAAVFCFAFSAVICWISYGKRAGGFLRGKSSGMFSFAFALALPMGAVIGSETLVLLLDYVMLPVAVICMLTLMKNSDEVIRVYKNGKYPRL